MKSDSNDILKKKNIGHSEIRQLHSIEKYLNNILDNYNLAGFIEYKLSRAVTDINRTVELLLDADCEVHKHFRKMNSSTLSKGEDSNEETET